MFGILLSEVHPDPFSAADFIGRHVRPGAQIEESELPEKLVFLEIAGWPGPPVQRGHSLRLLWRFDRQHQKWDEIMRSVSDHATWPHAFAVVARKALGKAAHSTYDEIVILVEAISETLAGELRKLDIDARQVAFSALFDLLASHRLDWVEDKSAEFLSQAVVHDVAARHRTLQ